MSTPPKAFVIVRQLGFWLLILLIGSAAGGVAGYVAAKTVAGGLDSRLSQLWSRVTTATSTTSTTPGTQIVPLETVRRPVYPAVFANRSVSPMVPVIRKAGLKLNEPLAIPEERTLGYGVTITSDGWIVVPTAAVTAPLTDLGIVWRGRLYPITRAMRDRVSDLVFIKIDGSNFPVTSFVSPVDVVPGLGVWAETAPRQFRPESIMATDARASMEIIPSEQLNRRFLVSLPRTGVRVGTAVWSENGGLVGLVVSLDERGVRLLPTTSISSAFSQVLATRSLQRSALGLRVQDVSSLVYEGARSDWPEQGILVRQVISTSTAKFLQEGDVIERMDRDAFDGIIDLGERLLDYRPGTVVRLQGVRKGKAFQVDVPLQATTTGETLK